MHLDEFTTGTLQRMDRNRNGRFLDYTLVLANVVILCAVAYVLVQPGSILRTRYGAWKQERARKRLLSTNWPAFVQGSSRLDVGTARVELIEFADYQCPFCKAVHPALESLLARDENVGIVFRHYPLPLHPAAEGAARASICAEAQGRFREMDMQLFSTSEWQRDTNWVREAVVAGVADTSLFSKCLTSGATSARLTADIALGNELRLNGTPAFVTRTSVAQGAMSSSQLLHLLAQDR